MGSLFQAYSVRYEQDTPFILSASRGEKAKWLHVHSEMLQVWEITMFKNV